MDDLSLEKAPMIYRVSCSLKSDGNVNGLKVRLKALGMWVFKCGTRRLGESEKEFIFLVYPKLPEGEEREDLLRTKIGVEMLVGAAWKEVQEKYFGNIDNFLESMGDGFKYLLLFYGLDFKQKLLECRSACWKESLELSVTTVDAQEVKNKPRL